MVAIAASLFLGGALVAIRYVASKYEGIMKLVRFVFINYPKLPDAYEKWQFVIGDVEVASLKRQQTESETMFFVYAIIPLKHLPKVTKENLIVVPKNERKHLEVAIEHSANLISLENSVKRDISSMSPYIAFYPESDEELSWLEKSDGVLSERKVNKGSIKGSFEIKLDEMLLHLTDRMDGVALIVESICQTHRSGKFHEYIRFFERAFKVSARKLIKPLSAFLEKSDLGYLEIEIEKWIDIRDPLTHADQRNYFYLQSDVAPYINRIEQAVYDVLFNKVKWRDAGIDRRNVWKPLSGSTSPGADIFVTQGKDLKLHIEFMDEFDAFAESFKILNNLPKGCWHKQSKQN